MSREMEAVKEAFLAGYAWGHEAAARKGDPDEDGEFDEAETAWAEYLAELEAEA